VGFLHWKNLSEKIMKGGPKNNFDNFDLAIIISFNKTISISFSDSAIKM
jgi:hypothetical protein